MTELPPSPDSASNTGVGSDRGSAASTPHWVKILGILAVILVLAFVVLHITGNSPFGPGGHGVPQP